MLPLHRYVPEELAAEHEEQQKRPRPSETAEIDLTADEDGAAGGPSSRGVAAVDAALEAMKKGARDAEHLLRHRRLPPPP